MSSQLPKPELLDCKICEAWVLPLLYAGAVLKEGMEIDLASIITLIFTGFLGFAGTLFFWRYADQY